MHKDGLRYIKNRLPVDIKRIQNLRPMTQRETALGTAKSRNWSIYKIRIINVGRLSKLLCDFFLKLSRIKLQLPSKYGN